MPRQLVIAIDGPAASGKSTTARLVAERLGYLYIDTGAMYRALGLKARRLGIPLSDLAAVAAVAEGTEIRQEQVAGGVATFLDGEDVSVAIRSPEISQAASDISTIPAVRRRLVALQQAMGRSGGVVMEGRDIGTVVFPDAEVKVYMEASLAERARRRGSELSARGIAARADELESQIAARDHQDSQREDSPLAVAPGAVVIDTTGLTVAQQVDRVVALAGDAAGGRR